jgi:5-methylcytosine-specific restriction endonuclease McrA
MNKEELQDYITQKLSIRQIAKECDTSYTSIRYWLKKYQIKPAYDKFGVKEYGETRFCTKCEKDVPTQNFYKRRNKLFSSVYCKDCSNRTTVERMREFKKKCVDYKGGECQICGYKKYIGALEFHHIDPSQKDFNISHFRKYSFDDITKYELDKCALLCANCHREVESGITLLK